MSENANGKKVKKAAARSGNGAKTAAKKAPAKRAAARLSTDAKTLPTDLPKLRQMLKISRDRRWRAGKRGDAALVEQMNKRVAELTAAIEKKREQS